MAMAHCMLVLLFGLIHLNSSGQKNVDCRSVHDGVFIMGGEDKSHSSTIRRKGDRQTEEAAYLGLKMRYKVTWTGECSYALTHRRVLKGTEPWPTQPTDTLFARIVAVTDGEVHLELRSSFAPLKYEGAMKRVR